MTPILASEGTAVSSPCAGRLWRAVLLRNAGAPEVRVKAAVLAGGLAIYLAMQLSLVGGVLRERFAPLETDDAYCYILKSRQIAEGLRLDQPAYRDLAEQLALPADNRRVEWVRATHRGRLFAFYHPLYSAALLGMKPVFGTWERAYAALQIAGVMFLGAAAAYFLTACWGAAAAGIALALIAPVAFPAQGLHYVVPSNLCLGLGLTAWARALRSGGRDSVGPILLAVAMPAMHPIGKLYAGMTLALYLLLQKRPLTRRAWLTAAAMTLVILAAVLLPRWIERPLLQVPRWPVPPEWSGMAGVWRNVREAGGILGDWLTVHGGRVFGFSAGAVIVLFGILSLPPAQRRAALGVGLLLALALAAAIGVVLPGYSAEAFKRLWIAWAIFFAGALARAIWVYVETMPRVARSLGRRGRQGLVDARGVVSLRGWRMLASVALGLLLARAAIWPWPHHLRHRHFVRSRMLERYYLALDTAQPARLAQAAAPGDAALYANDVLLMFFLCQGAARVGAVDWAALEGTAAESRFLGEDSTIRYVLAGSPVARRIEGEFRNGTGWLPLRIGDTLLFRRGNGGPSDGVALRLDGMEDATARFTASVKGQEAVVSVPVGIRPGLDTVSEFLLPGTREPTVRLRTARAKDPALWIKGIRLDAGADDARCWPWDEDATLLWRRAGQAEAEAEEFRFRSDRLLPAMGRRLRVLEDYGYSVLAKVAE